MQDNNQNTPNLSPTPLRIAVFGSGKGSNLRLLLDALDPNKYQISCLFSDRECPFLEIGKQAGIPTVCLPFASFRDAYKGGKDDVKLAYDEELLRRIKEYPIDLILLAGYMRILQKPILSRFSGRILNIHPADLSLKSADGKRRYVGANSVQDALENGESGTRSSVIFVDAGVDTGPILVIGPEVAYSEGMPLTKEKRERHQEKQKRESDFPACREALRLVQEGRVSFGEKKELLIDGRPFPEGVKLDQAGSCRI